MIIVMDEDLDGSLVHKIRFGKGERLSHQSPHSLADRVVVAFNMVCFATPLAAVVLSSRHHLSISRPKIAVAEAAFVSGRDALPQHTTSGLTATANSISDDLSGATAQRQPQPTLVDTPVNP